MRIASWNCCMAFRNKWEYLDAYDPDIMVVPEAEEPSRLPEELMLRYPHSLWAGDIPFKGLLVLGKEKHELRLTDRYNPAHRFVLPIEVDGTRTLNLLAVWTQRGDDRHYTDQVWAAVHEYEDLLAGDSVIIGDFNSSAIWDDQMGRSATHSGIVEWLHERGLHSAYHHVTGDVQGKETQPTHSHLKRPDRLCHIDHCFVSESLLGSQSAVVIPAIDSWIELSDHAPLIVDVSQP